MMQLPHQFCHSPNCNNGLASKLQICYCSLLVFITFAASLKTPPGTCSNHAWLTCQLPDLLLLLSNICNSTTTGITNNTTATDPLSLFYGSTTTGICNRTFSNPPDLFWNSTTTRNQQSAQQQEQFGCDNNIIDPRVASSINLTAQSISPSNSIFVRPIPTLKYTPCIKPPLQPSSYKLRLLWILQRTPAAVHDFKITQVLHFRKLLRSFSHQHSRIQHYLKFFFIPLADCFETKVERKCFNYCEALKFVTLKGHSGTESFTYVTEHIKELAANN
ncbi:unnamed protein product [Mucor hiemalis]